MSLLDHLHHDRGARLTVEGRLHRAEERCSQLALERDAAEARTTRVLDELQRTRTVAVLRQADYAEANALLRNGIAVRQRRVEALEHDLAEEKASAKRWQHRWAADMLHLLDVERELERFGVAIRRPQGAARVAIRRSEQAAR